MLYEPSCTLFTKPVMAHVCPLYVPEYVTPYM